MDEASSREDVEKSRSKRRKDIWSPAEAWELSEKKLSFGAVRLDSSCETGVFILLEDDDELLSSLNALFIELEGAVFIVAEEVIEDIESRVKK
jgi:hypothetical protein